MVSWLKRYWPALVLSALLLAMIDAVISSLITCHPAATGSANSQRQQECTALAGPILTSLSGIVNFLDHHGEAVTGVFTIVLAAFTGRLWYSTEGLYRVTKIVADADRPHMIPDRFSLKGMSGPPVQDGNVRIDIDFRFVNYGRSPAFMKRFCFSFEAEPLKPAPIYSFLSDVNRIIPVNGWWGAAEPTYVLVQQQVAKKVLTGAVRAYIFGVIEYGDTAGQDHRFRFAYAFDFGADGNSTRFDPAGPPSYHEYT